MLDCPDFFPECTYDVHVLRWYLKFDYSSLLCSRVTHHWILAISHRECTRGGNFCPSLWEIDRIRWLITPVPNKLTWSNLRYHLSTSYSTFWEKIWAIQHCWLISEQEVTSAENGLVLMWVNVTYCVDCSLCNYYPISLAHITITCTTPYLASFPVLDPHAP